MNDTVDKLFTARLSDLLSRSERDCCPVFTQFLDERQCAAAEQWCAFNAGESGYALWGGFEGARRRMLAVFPEYCRDGLYDSFPMACLSFSFRKEDTLTHRDFLGSFMALQLKREVIGDIIIDEGNAQAFVTDVAARDIKSTVSRIGRVGVRITDDRPFEMEIRQEFKDISGTVASLRLDCVVSLAANVSRENAARLIRSEKVDIDHFTVTSVSHEVSEGSVLSIRGSGRYILSGINGSTKKGRIHIKLQKYI